MPFPILIALGCAVATPFVKAICESGQADDDSANSGSNNTQGDSDSGFCPSDRNESTGGERQTTLDEF